MRRFISNATTILEEAPILFIVLSVFTRSISASPGDKNNGVKVRQLSCGLHSGLHAIEHRIREIERTLFDLHIALEDIEVSGLEAKLN